MVVKCGALRNVRRHVAADVAEAFGRASATCLLLMPEEERSMPGFHGASARAEPAHRDGGSEVHAPPDVSVILPTFRRAAFLRRAIASVQAQTTQAWELIIVDDNGDGEHRRATEAIVKDLSADSRVRYVQHSENRGGGAARNSGVRLATAPFVAFLDDDDEWHSTKLERQLACFEDAPDSVALVYCRVRVVFTKTGHERYTPTMGRSPSVSELLRRNSVGTTSGVLCRANALREVGLFDETLPARQDLDLYVRLAARFSFAFVDAPLVTVHVHGDARISTNLEDSIRANELFTLKYRTRVEADSEVRHALIYDLGRLLVAAGRYREARSVLARAWCTRPLDLRIAARLAQTFSATRAIAGRARCARSMLRRPRG